MGKKLVKFLFIFALVGSGFFGVVGSKAEAASSNGGYIKTNGGKCTVRLYSDYYTYSKTASTVDAWATASGTCNTMYYTMRIKYGDSGHNAGTQIHTEASASNPLQRHSRLVELVKQNRPILTEYGSMFTLTQLKLTRLVQQIQK